MTADQHMAELRRRVEAGRDPTRTVAQALDQIMMELGGVLDRGTNEEHWRKLAGPAVDLLSAVSALVDEEEAGMSEP